VLRGIFGPKSGRGSNRKTEKLRNEKLHNLYFDHISLGLSDQVA
jgi:hypothetical protein